MPRPAAAATASATAAASAVSAAARRRFLGLRHLFGDGCLPAAAGLGRPHRLFGLRARAACSMSARAPAVCRVGLGSPRSRSRSRPLGRGLGPLLLLHLGSPARVRASPPASAFRPPRPRAPAPRRASGPRAARACGCGRLRSAAPASAASCLGRAARSGSGASIGLAATRASGGASGHSRRFGVRLRLGLGCRGRARGCGFAAGRGGCTGSVWAASGCGSAAVRPPAGSGAAALIASNSALGHQRHLGHGDLRRILGLLEEAIPDQHPEDQARMPDARNDRRPCP